MIYPYFLYDKSIRLYPIFKNLVGPPLLVDFSPRSDLLGGIEVNDQRSLQKALENRMEGRHSWGMAAYLERRDTLLSGYPQMVEEQRFIHLGLDIIVPLGEKLHAPLDSVVQEVGYEEGDGNYGAFVLLRHESPAYAPFYSFYGHLSRGSLPSLGEKFSAGFPFAEIGDFHENGNWFYHTHLQIITQKGYERGYMSKGYCSDTDMAEIDSLCPSPIPLFSLC